MPSHDAAHKSECTVLLQASKHFWSTREKLLGIFRNLMSDTLAR